MSPLLLNVPYFEKDQAKANGAFWEPTLKTWYLPEGKLHLFPAVAKWLPEKEVNIIISELIIAHAHRSCWKCSHVNTVIALGAPSFYEINSETNSCDVSDFFTLFQEISTLSAHLATFLKQHYPHFKPGYSKTTATTNWNNHCSSCNSLQGEWFLFQEPGAAFYPTTPSEAQHIIIKQHPLEYAVLLHAGYSYGDSLDLMEEHARWE
ncbi:DUF5710 domain-containing protein [[Flexibacter] sp. ATCC 35208]|uniref:DUF5710 domain-containing protein n=1 Tax=[Flexibacter] sp. ATCC 35208 TaxID=1936242 RepID=UPI0009CD4E69|nr:DUF5710 domain-containing protein [[Flexibacter] sp. ATCC 35208]OMP74736.1 hypothetical protein BW716_33815 [[Flexibacter] sp. ATCC 35208]